MTPESGQNPGAGRRGRSIQTVDELRQRFPVIVFFRVGNIVIGLGSLIDVIEGTVFHYAEPAVFPHGQVKQKDKTCAAVDRNRRIGYTVCIKNGQTRRKDTKTENNKNREGNAVELEKYIKDLSPELQEKARKCKSVDELLALAKDEKIPLPDEALEAIAGGREGEDQSCGKEKCPACGSKKTHVTSKQEVQMGWILHYKCGDCGHTWEKFVYYPY